LEEIIAEAAGFRPGGRPGRALYFSLIREFGNEHRILTEVPPAEIGRAAPGRLAAGIERVRRSRVTVSPGYDGTYGRIRIFDRSL